MTHTKLLEYAKAAKERADKSKRERALYGMATYRDFEDAKNDAATITLADAVIRLVEENEELKQKIAQMTDKR